MHPLDLVSIGTPAGAWAARERWSILSTGEPVVVDLSVLTPATMDELGPACGVALREIAAPVVVVGEPSAAPEWLVEAADICVTTRLDATREWVTGDPAAVVSAVIAQPLAALALVRLLRATIALPVHDAIDAEASTYAALLGSRSHREWLAARETRPHHDGEAEPVIVRRVDHVLHVELNRPQVRNALDRSMRDHLVQALALAEANPGLHVELSGKGPSFCSGGDLSEFGLVEDPATAIAIRASQHPGASAHRVASRLTATVHGSCVGAGVEIPAFAWKVIARGDATFRLPELAMGLVPGAGGTVSIPRRIGRHRTAWLAVTGEPLCAGTALEWGLVDELG